MATSTATDHACDHCNTQAELYHNEATGLALCEACDRTADERENRSCDGCRGDGIYYGRGRVENGKFIGFTGRCYRCGGKGWQNAADAKRNAYYDNHVRRIAV